MGRVCRSTSAPRPTSAAALFLSPATVQTHVTNSLIKLGAKNRAHGISIALRAGELDLGEGPDELSLLGRH